MKVQLFEPKSFSDTIACNREIQRVLLKLNSEGYLAAGFDDIKYDSSTCQAYLYLGSQFKWASLLKGNVEEGFLSGTGFRQKLYTEKIFQFEEVNKLQEKILVNCQNNGYPFASVRLDSIEIIEHLIHAKLELTKNKFIRFDSVVVKGNSTIAPVYIYNYIGIKPGSVYNEALVSKISRRLQELSFVKEISSNRVLFSEDQTRLELFLENKKASRFDGVVGLAPDPVNSGKYIVTGEAHIKLQNALARGEILELNWKQLPVQSQDLKLHFLYPFLFNTPFGLDASLRLFKKDTTYIDVYKSLGIHYQLTGNNFLRLFIDNKESTVEATSSLVGLKTLPEYANVSITSYGVGFHYEKLDYRLNPRSGFSFETIGSTGIRTISKIKELDPSVYDSIKLNSTQYRAELSFDYYFPLSIRHVINLGTQGAFQYSPDMFTNELYRFGGLKSLRGFDEESILASAYAIGKIEYRYLLELNSYLFVFYNQSYYQNKSNNKNLYDTPSGFGSGITLETKLGILSVSYALGKEFDNPIYFRNGKIHFGILNYF